MSSITLRFLAEPSTVNFGGKVHGGTVMKWIDEAAYACATRWAKRYCVTVSVGSIRFQRPIMIGDLVEVAARLAYTGKTSMNISVEVRAGDMKTGQMEVITECLAVFVAVDADGQTIPESARRCRTTAGPRIGRRQASDGRPIRPWAASPRAGPGTCRRGPCS